MEEIRIMFNDLIPKKQKEVLEAYGIMKPEEMNWDVFPLVIIPIEND